MPFRPLRRRLWERWALVVALFVAGGGRAGARGLRPFFEPTDLELEQPGVVEADLQVGAIRGQGPGPWRAVIPDLELDVGLLRNLELDLDAAYAIEGPDMGPFSFDHAAPDNLWPSAKIGIVDFADDGKGGGWVDAWGIGTQIGPKLPVAPGAHGIGAEGLLLVGYAVKRTHLVLNLGGFYDPHPDATSVRPVAAEAGLDLDQDLDKEGHFSIKGELSAVHFRQGYSDQLAATLGLAWSPVDAFELSLSGLWGFLAGGDRYGALLGISPKIRFFRSK
jgi:hypothetical protein